MRLQRAFCVITLGHFLGTGKRPPRPAAGAGVGVRVPRRTPGGRGAASASRCRGACWFRTPARSAPWTGPGTHGALAPAARRSRQPWRARGPSAVRSAALRPERAASLRCCLPPVRRHCGHAPVGLPSPARVVWASAALSPPSPRAAAALRVGHCSPLASRRAGDVCSCVVVVSSFKRLMAQQGPRGPGSQTLPPSDRGPTGDSREQALREDFLGFLPLL